MKKIYILTAALLSAAATTAQIPQPVNPTIPLIMNIAASSENDVTEITVDGINYSLDNTKLEATVTGCSSSVSTLVMPNSISANEKTYAVVAVAKAAFQANRTLTSISLPKSLKVINTDAFRNLSNLKELKIEDLASWCNVWFANGNANPIYNVFPTTQSKWGKVYINGQQVSTQVTVPEGVTRLGRTFYGFKSLTSVILPSTLKVLGDQTFANCEKLLSCTIPESVDSIGSAFWSCKSLTDIDVPRAVKYLGNSTFYGCSKLANVKLHTGLKTIGSMTFTSCSALTTLELPATVDSINPSAFMSANNLTSLSCKAVTPPSTRAGAFSDFAATCTLAVPEASIPAYKAAPGWSEFANVIILTNAVGSLETEEGPAEYFDLNGLRVSEENLAPGIYVRIRGGKATKVLVK